MSLNLSIIELSVLLFCAVTLGVVIHFFITTRKNLKNTSFGKDKIKRGNDEWKLKYFNESEVKEKELSDIKTKLIEAEDNNRIYRIEIEELRKDQKRIQADINTTQKGLPTGETKPHYIEQLRVAQINLLEHNEKINQLLENIEVIRENEEKQKLIEEENEELLNEVKDLRLLLKQKENEISIIQKKEHLTKEMTSMLDNAYSEFNNLQEKIQRLESQLSSNKMLSIEYEDLKEAYQKVTREFDEQKTKLHVAVEEHDIMKHEYIEMQDKLREANFQRQQLQKRVSYLEELNTDLQMVADANKKLENQLRRIGELESMLNMVSEENQVLKRQVNH
jgi:chromosome segregation ATPase